jgi:hypothetical protein
VTAISWKSPVSGDWNVAANWSTGTVPTFSDDVTISALGSVTGYTVTISSDDQAHSLSDGELGVGGGTLVENAGSLSIAGQLIVEFESVTLNEANPIESVWDSGQVNFGNPAALGSGTVTVVDGHVARDHERIAHQRALVFGRWDDRRRNWNDAGCKRIGYNIRFVIPGHRAVWGRRNDPLARRLD